MIRITFSLAIPETEVRYVASRSSGPGGQHLNKASTKVTLVFDLRNSPSLGPAQKRRLLQALGRRVNRDGILRISSQQYRSQAANRQAALDRFVELLHGGLRPRPQRKRTSVPAAARQRRLRAKRRRSLLKRQRSHRPELEEY